MKPVWKMEQKGMIKPVVVLISADIEWDAVRALFPDAEMQVSPYGEWFSMRSIMPGDSSLIPLIYFHGGWGKISAAGSTQYVIDCWRPALLINLGTCGGFEGEIERGTIILVERTIVYDIVEQMGDFDEHIAHYTTHLDLSWLKEPFPMEVRRSLLVSGDKDLLVEEIPLLKARYHAIAGDWESGAIAFVAARNQTRCLILRGVTDLVGTSGGEAYGNIQLFKETTGLIMQRLVEALSGWVEKLPEC
jgi:adenosylhomocysteine nucleosidase